MSGPAARLIQAALAAADSETAPVRGRAVAVGWATVDVDRAIAALAADLGVPAASFVRASDSTLLGAWCRVANGALTDGRALVVLEPAREGPLAAILARDDEGPRVVWIESVAVSEDIAAGPPAPGPFGPERLVVGRPADGLCRLLVRPVPGTIRP